MTALRTAGCMGLLIGLAGCGSSPAPRPGAAKANAAAAAAPAVRVSVAAARQGPLASDAALTAEFRADQEVDVMAKTSGYLKKIEVDVGDPVRQGQLLATIEVPEMEDELAKNEVAITRSRSELERARLEVGRARTAREMTELSYSRLASVMEKRPGLVAQQEIDTVRNRDLLAQSQIATAQSALTSAEQSVRMLEAETARLRTLQSYTRVTAPFDGLVTKRFADVGALIQAGTSSQAKPLVRIAQTRKVRLVLPVPEAVVPRLRVGSAIEVRVESLNRTFTGRIARFSHQIQTATRTMETEVDVPNPSGVLVPGMFAQALLRLDERTQAITVPVEAVDHEKDGASVLVASGGTLERRGVTLGLETPERVEIRQGLAAGELVVLGNRSQYRAGQKVEVLRVDGGESAAVAPGKGRG
ncbi:MAG: efflux RND transporter periplasmic adaptor subunit [Bryobacterales bacterium]|nr:efflux RND transporter periplasmic adaptor subunit [Bryobacterales bacterium]